MMKGKPICVVCHDYSMPNSLYCVWCHKKLETLRKQHAYDVLAVLVPILEDVTERDFRAMCGGEIL